MQTAPTVRGTYTVTEASEMIGCSTRHLYDLAAAGQIATVPHMGRRVLIPRWAIDRLLDDPQAA